MAKVLIIGAGGGRSGRHAQVCPGPGGLLREEVRSQVISYTPGVPAMIGAKQMLTGEWRGDGVFNMEQFDPDPFMADLTRYGLPWRVRTLDEPLD